MAIFAQFEVDMPDDPKIIEAGDMAELVYYRAIMRCREHLTDGVIDRRVLTRWFAGIRGKTTKHLDTLVTIGLLREHPDGWCIPSHVWRRRNPLKSEVEEKRSEEAARKADYRARKQAERSPVPQVSQRDMSQCPTVVPDLSHDAIDIAIGIATDRAIDRAIARDSSSSQVTEPVEPPARDDRLIVNEIIEAVARLRCDRYCDSRDPDVRQRYLGTTVTKMNRTERDAIAKLLAERPHMADAIGLAAQFYDAGKAAS